MLSPVAGANRNGPFRFALVFRFVCLSVHVSEALLFCMFPTAYTSNNNRSNWFLEPSMNIDYLYHNCPYLEACVTSLEDIISNRNNIQFTHEKTAITSRKSIQKRTPQKTRTKCSEQQQ
ncbi:hypothetical protein B0T09DRAFT_63665 [Sordaria sp. MPI-SDFR-AT-0083]|nr:hypothetical protein B0T09DRAFT_63665 [Sordaria sp. MPI-SDFR-AT-0083]